MKIIVGNKIKKYLIITCMHCNESFRVDNRMIMNEVQSNLYHIRKFQCPWCEGEMDVDVFSPQNDYMYVKED